MDIDNRQRGALLAGLRSLQRDRVVRRSLTEIRSIEIASDTGHTPLSHDEINHLCVMLQQGYPELIKADTYFQEKYSTSPTQPDDCVVLKQTQLSTRLKNALREQGLQTVGDLKNLSRYRFLRFFHVGRVALDELERFLGRPLSSAQFPEVEGEKRSERLERYKQWSKEN